jgi:leucyl aminopeptidase|tara:strand:+ start:66873 stop:68255 length:1383 start_codon:yes stop_codon:yes gene_type:complete
MKYTFEKRENKDTVQVALASRKKTRLIERDGKLIIELGVGNVKEVTGRKLVVLARLIIKVAKENNVRRIAITLSDFSFPKIKKLDDTELCSILAQNFEMANFEFNRFKKEPKEGWREVEEIIAVGASRDCQKGFKKGQIIGDGINRCRELANTPGGEMTPTLLAKEAESAAKGTEVSVLVFSKKKLEELKMGAILGVSKGSVEEPKFIVLEYWGAKNKKDPIVLVGKGVTFDTGGLNLKPSDSILGMHLDMSGGAAVIHSVILAAKLGLKKNVVGLVPAVENMPSGSSYRPGDILKSMSGKSIEIIDTDAEGRVILADALTYAKKYKPRLVVDVATLTGASLVALGQHASAFLTTESDLQVLFDKLGEESGDYMWPLPLWSEYEEYTKGVFADVANIPATGNTRYGGAINGGAFLYQFAKDYTWAHIDMAPRMTTIPSDNLAKGAAGAPVRFLTKLVEKY